MNRPSHLRRTLFALAPSLLALPFACAQAPAYPTRAVSIIVGAAPGGAPDILARLPATRLSDKLGKQFIVENKPGAAGMLGARLAAGAPADGHTLFLGTVSTNAIVASAYKLPGYHSGFAGRRLPHDSGLDGCGKQGGRTPAARARAFPSGSHAR